ncbi:unnamed protein product [Hyaloperonospora brassicae]|nr:unnamed protein product [Hyaloperonospora brassicae]
MVEVPTQDGEHVEVQVDVAPELPVPPIQTQTDAETPVMETPVHEEEHVGVQPETPDPDVALVPETSPLQTEDTSVPETVREETVGEYPIPAPMVPCPAFTLVPETAPEEMIGEYATPAMETPCPVFTLVPELEPSRVETTIEAHPDLTHVQQETSPESDTPMTGDVLEPHFTGAQVGNSGTEQTDEVVVVEDSTGPMQLAMDQMDQSASPMQSAMDQVDQSASPMQSAVDQVDQSTSPMQSAMDPTDQSTGFFDTGVDAIVETPEDVADAITADPTDIITTN